MSTVWHNLGFSVNNQRLRSPRFSFIRKSQPNVSGNPQQNPQTHAYVWAYSQPLRMRQTRENAQGPPSAHRLDALISLTFFIVLPKPGSETRVYNGRAHGRVIDRLGEFIFFIFLGRFVPKRAELTDPDFLSFGSTGVYLLLSFDRCDHFKGRMANTTALHCIILGKHSFRNDG